MFYNKHLCNKYPYKIQTQNIWKQVKLCSISLFYNLLTDDNAQEWCFHVQNFDFIFSAQKVENSAAALLS